MIREQLLGAGSWSVRLDLPRGLADELDRYDNVVVTPTWAAGAVLTRSEVIALARYRGVLLEYAPDGSELAGAGLLWYLGDGDGIGDGYTDGSSSTPPGYNGETARTFDSWLSQMETDGVLNGLTVGTAVNVNSSTWPDSGSDGALPLNTREALELLAQALEAEWAIAPDGEITPLGRLTASFFNRGGSGVVCVLADGGSRDYQHGRQRVPVLSWDPVEDSTSYVNKVYVTWDNGGTINTATDSRSETVKDAAGSSNIVRAVAIEDNDASTSADAAATGGGLLNGTDVRQQLTVTVDLDDPGQYLKPGDEVAIWHPELGLADDTGANQQRVLDGHPCRPVYRRVFSMEWPVTAGMGVYLVPSSSSDDPIDLTPYLEADDRPTRLEVGARARTAFDP